MNHFSAAIYRQAADDGRYRHPRGGWTSACKARPGMAYLPGRMRRGNAIRSVYFNTFKHEIMTLAIDSLSNKVIDQEVACDAHGRRTL